MSKSTLLIPSKCKVGFQERNDTYTGLLAYIIMFDGKKWRKEPSWNDWRQNYITKEELDKKKKEDFDSRIKLSTDTYNKYKENPYESYEWEYYNKNIKPYTLQEYLDKTVGSFKNYNYYNWKESSNVKIKPQEFDNTPMEGFVLNKKVGDHSSGWNHRTGKCRVYDPRGWEFEIPFENLLYILQETNSYKGKGLEGEFVYSWDGKDLVLLPTSTIEYQESLNHTKMQDGKLYKKDMVPGYTYRDKNGNDFIYIGHYEYIERDNYSKKAYKKGKKYIFQYSSQYESNVTKSYSNLSNFKQCVNKEIPEDFNATLEKVINYNTVLGIKEEIFKSVDIKDLEPSYKKIHYVLLYLENKPVKVKIVCTWRLYSNEYTYYVNNKETNLNELLEKYKKKLVTFKDGKTYNLC